MTKQGFIKRVQETLARQGREYRLADLEAVLQVVFGSIKNVIAEGDQLHVSGLGKFYTKEMGPRVVRGGLKKDGRRYLLPPRKKLGFSSFGSTDRFIQRGRVNRNMNGLFADVFGE